MDFYEKACELQKELNLSDWGDAAWILLHKQVYGDKCGQPHPIPVPVQVPAEGKRA